MIILLANHSSVAGILKATSRVDIWKKTDLEEKPVFCEYKFWALDLGMRFLTNKTHCWLWMCRALLVMQLSLFCTGEKKLLAIGTY